MPEEKLPTLVNYKVRQTHHYIPKQIVGVIKRQDVHL